MKKFLALALAVVMCFALAACGCEQDKTEFKVGIVQLMQHDALDAATKGFKDALTERMTAAGKTVVFEEKNASGEFDQCSQIVNTFVAGNVDLIMANATPALQAAYNATQTIPILGTSVTEYGVALNLKNFNKVTGTNVSGTSDLAPLKDQAQMIIDLVPAAKTVGLIYCGSEANSAYQVKEVKEYLESKGLITVDCKFADSNDLATIVSGKANECDAFYIPTDNTAASNAPLIYESAVNTDGKRIPIIAGEENTCKGCGIATLSIDYYELGKKTGEMAAEILLNGKDITTMEIGYAPNPTYKYNADICADLGIDTAALDAMGYVAIGAEEAVEETDEAASETEAEVASEN